MTVHHHPFWQTPAAEAKIQQKDGMQQFTAWQLN